MARKANWKDRVLPKEQQRGDMEMTPERIMAVKMALIKQYEDQYGVKITAFTEINKETMEAKRTVLPG